MKNTTKMLIIAIIIVFSIAAAFLLLAPARTFIIDGIQYKVLTESGAAGTAEVIANGYYGDVTIPETVDNSGVTYTVTSIGASAFRECYSLTSVSIPAGVTSVQSDAFSYCINLGDIVFKGSTPPELGSGLFRQVPDGLEVVVPRDAVAAYADALSGKLPADSQMSLSVNIAAVPGVTAPVRSAVPAAAVTETEQYTGTIEWTPADSSFDGNTTYTAAITLTAKTGYTLIGVAANFFTVEGADSVSSAADSGVITAVFPATAPQVVVDIPSVSGVTPPVRGAVPAAAITGAQQYTGTVFWSPAEDPFAGNTVYTAAITLEREPGYTFTGVPANFFTVEGADSVSSAADSGVITAIFPVTATEIGDTITADGVNCKVLTKSGAAGTAEVIAGSYSGAIAIPKTIDSAGVTYTVVSIGEGAFYDCSGLISVNIPRSVTSIGKDAFQDCSSLKKISLPAGVTSIGDYAFAYCASLTSITIPKGVASIGDFTFYSCSCLKSVSIPSSVTTVGKYAFAYCSSLTGITISGSVASIGDYAFAYCDSLTGLTTLGSMISIGDCAFYSCTGLKKIKTFGSINIGISVFKNCPSLESIIIHGDMTAGPSAFAN